jgi:hypothetical protein
MSNVRFVNPDSVDNEVEETKGRAPRTLDKFLAAVRMDSETMDLYVKSLDSHVTIQELNSRQMTKISQFQQAGKSEFEIATEIVGNSLVYPDVNSPDVINEFRAKLGNEGLTRNEIVARLFKAGEIPLIAEKVMELSGVGEEAIIEAKN